MDKKEIKTIQEITEKLLKLLDVEGGFEISESTTNGAESVDIVLNTKDTGVVIGYHGDTLEGLQLVLSLCVARSLKRFVRISIDAGDYKKNRTEFLRTLALETKEKVLAEGKEIVVPELKSWERRIVHLLLEKDEDVASGSQGEGRDRVLVVHPKAK
ncbi:MAG: KH domain-containing protein [Candidatus Levybacteria bacterium]|nr:KH domain-containing protein [Candidatus Levybacteria bacterium]